MEWNRNKIIFAVVGGILAISLLFLLIMMMSNTGKDDNQSGDDMVRIWMVGENFDSYDFVNKFKELYPSYKNKSVTVDVFPSYEDYTYTLTSAISSGVAPDIFVLNSGEKNSVFSNQIMGISSSKVNPNDFRKIYKGFFSDNLIETYSDDSGSREQLIGIPVGYETLGIYYNRRYVRSSDLNNLSSLSNIVANLKNSQSGVIPLGIGNGTTVPGAEDILSQFFMLSGANGIAQLSGNPLKEGLAAYLAYGDVSGINGYNSKFSELKMNKQDAITLFVNGEVLMVIGYPSLINRIKDKGGFAKNFLEVVPFPHYFSGGGDTLANYNYFVINKNTLNIDFAQDFMQYLSSDNGATNFLNSYPYYLPALLSLEGTMIDKKIDENYNVVLGDFYNDSFELASFEKGVKVLYDIELPLLLDNAYFQEDLYNNWRESLVCRLNKITNFSNLSTRCN